jgi:hypothetical protein
MAECNAATIDIDVIVAHVRRPRVDRLDRDVVSDRIAGTERDLVHAIEILIVPGFRCTRTMHNAEGGYQHRV